MKEYIKRSWNCDAVFIDYYYFLFVCLLTYAIEVKYTTIKFIHRYCYSCYIIASQPISSYRDAGIAVFIFNNNFESITW